ncbi:hypothetical protein BESB_067890 [Besnoitia besnoiti]|uniref:Transmembrane protein n=1 Tax=Besnoitia besnoiti TaxID=94643 RepID=A0A2A9MFK7_BESBE|nr:hypothetical protein BESB_067890 [Besnoitia besnoiti]PFH34756.1 hypothetical protein BESB_067890 [Besnoitia besnoiti]
MTIAGALKGLLQATGYNLKPEEIQVMSLEEDKDARVISFSISKYRGMRLYWRAIRAWLRNACGEMMILQDALGDTLPVDCSIPLVTFRSTGQTLTEADIPLGNDDEPIAPALSKPARPWTLDLENSEADGLMPAQGGNRESRQTERWLNASKQLEQKQKASRHTPAQPTTPEFMPNYIVPPWAAANHVMPPQGYSIPYPPPGGVDPPPSAYTQHSGMRSAVGGALDGAQNSDEESPKAGSTTKASQGATQAAAGEGGSPHSVSVKFIIVASCLAATLLVIVLLWCARTLRNKDETHNPSVERQRIPHELKLRRAGARYARP